MAFHCNVCGSDLAGDYESCPVCEKVRAILGSFKEPGFVAPAEPEKTVIMPVEVTPEEVTPAEPEEVFEELPAEEPAAEDTETFEAESVPEEEIPAEEPEVFEDEEPVIDGFAADETSREEPVFGDLPEEEPYEEPVAEAEEPEVTFAPEAEEAEEISAAEETLPQQEDAPEEESFEESAELIPAAEAAEVAVSADEPEPQESLAYGLLENQLLEKAAANPNRKKRGGAVFGVIVVLLTILLAVCTAIYVAVPLIDRHAEEQAAASYIEYLEGQWLSEYFAFKDRPSECCVELLTVTAEGTFTMDYLLPDTENPEGWRDGSWQSTYKVIGTVKIDAATQRLMLLYDESGVSYFYDRYFVSMDEGEMYLREYYDEAHTSYYDVCFNKVA